MPNLDPAASSPRSQHLLPAQLLTTQGRVLVLLAREPDLRYREIALALEVTERTITSAVAELVAAGLITRQRRGRRFRYVVTIPPVPEEVADLLGIGGVSRHRDDRSVADGDG